MENFYTLPLTREYESRGCKVKINAAENPKFVDISVVNMKSGYGSNHRHILDSRSNKGYSDTDIFDIKKALNNLLDQYGDNTTSCNTHFTNQILS